jgi:NADH:ubiquinone oxidoreductase subunit 4 (subunit M)
MTGFEKAAGIILVANLILIGLYPSLMVDLIQSSVKPLVQTLFPVGIDLKARL